MTTKPPTAEARLEAVIYALTHRDMNIKFMRFMGALDSHYPLMSYHVIEAIDLYLLGKVKP